MHYIPGTLAVWWWWRGKPRVTGLTVHKWAASLTPNVLVTFQLINNEVPTKRHKNALRQLRHNGLFVGVWIRLGWLRKAV